MIYIYIYIFFFFFFGSIYSRQFLVKLVATPALNEENARREFTKYTLKFVHFFFLFFFSFVGMAIV